MLTKNYFYLFIYITITTFMPTPCNHWTHCRSEKKSLPVHQMYFKCSSSKSLINIYCLSPVCSPGSGGFQCVCEDQYRWSCDQCFLYGSCDNITDDTCGCIKTIPPDGQYCQPVDQHSKQFFTRLALKLMHEEKTIFMHFL